ncbi:MAG: metalloregulator ArsR/SmtB family transcription factor [Actinomycetota bacterium]
MAEAPDDLDELVRAVSNSTRRRILRLCVDRHIPAGSIASEIDLAPASVSEHLKVLRKTGLVELERTGTSWRYRTDRARTAVVLERLAADLPTSGEPTRSAS